MATRASAVHQQGPAEWGLTGLGSFPRLRALAWHGNVLYASRGYSLLRAKITTAQPQWEHVARSNPPWWRVCTASSRLSFRLCRDGFHALAVLPNGRLVGAVPHYIVTLAPADEAFTVSHKILRGTRPLHIAATPDGHLFWGEYFNNAEREEVRIYGSSDGGRHWDVAYLFEKGAIRHVHNIVYDRWDDCLWILTGDEGAECRILRASCDFRNVEVALSGTQQTRSAALVPMADAIYFSSDTPFETNHIYRLDRRGGLSEIATLSSSSICGCAVGDAVFFSTMVEPSAANPEGKVHVYGGTPGGDWQQLLTWNKDRWPMKWFQFGNAFLPDGHNTSGVLAVSTIATQTDDLRTTVWRISIA